MTANPADESSTELALWRRFAAASASAWLPLWLELLCRRVPGVQAGVLLRVTAENSTLFRPLASWCCRAEEAGEGWGEVAKEALELRRGVIRRLSAEGDRERAWLAYPVDMEQQPVGAIVVDLSFSQEQQLLTCLREMHWASHGWRAWELEERLRQAQGARQLAWGMLDVLATVQASVDLQSTGFALVNALADDFLCSRVALGLVQGRHVDVVAISRMAWIEKGQTFVQRLQTAMDETLQAGTLIVCTPPGPTLEHPGHALLAREEQNALLSVCLGAQDHAAVLLLQRGMDQPFSPDETHRLETLAALLGPLLAARRQAARNWGRHGWDSLKTGLQRLWGPRHYTLKTVSVLTVVLLLALTVIPVTYQVSAPVAIEGQMQRTLAAPFAGYISKSMHRAGEKVRQGEVLALMEDKDLRIEQARWRSDSEQYARKLREAWAERNLADTQILQAQYEEAQAQLNLANDKLARVRLEAPFDAIIVSGDLSQSVGEPVEEGKTLFEVAPLKRYNVVLKVDERDIAQIQPGQQGGLLLSGMPTLRYAFKVLRVVPVAVAEEGRNYFRVEAALGDSNWRLRPGMEGVGKIRVGPHALLWIWTHHFTDWLRVQWWSW